MRISISEFTHNVIIDIVDRRKLAIQLRSLGITDGPSMHNVLGHAKFYCGELPIGEVIAVLDMWLYDESMSGITLKAVDECHISVEMPLEYLDAHPEVRDIVDLSANRQ